MAILAILSLFVVLVFRPVDTSKANRLNVAGTVQSVEEIGSGDIIFTLQDDETEYYINRGRQRGLQPEDLEGRLIGREVAIEYADHWTPLDPAGRHRHVTGLRFEGTALYSE